MSVDPESLSLHAFYGSNVHPDPFERAKQFYSVLEDARRCGQYSYRRTLVGPSQAHVSVVDDDASQPREMLMFGSNNYLDLANHPQVTAAAREALDCYGYGAGSVALLAGTQQIHRQLEQRLADFYQRPAAVVFPSGYAANLGTISALLGESDLALVDLYAHRSLTDGTRLAGCLTKFYGHNNLKQLRQLLERFRSRYQNIWIITDGVFSMDGDTCPLPDLIAIAGEYGAHLLIDEAHAIGVMGDRGRGTEEHFGLPGQTDVILGTLSKAPAGLGGYLVGNVEVVEWVRHFASPYVFSTNLPAPVVAGLLAALDIIENDPERRKRLKDNARYFVQCLRAAGFLIEGTESAIVPVILGGESVTRQIAKGLHEHAIFACPVVFPAVSKTRARIRFSVMSSHSRSDLDRVSEVMQALGRMHGLIT
jgi:4-hydroxy-2,2'-bipyrrole-5-methanol synthase